MISYLIHHINGVSAVGIHRFIEGDRIHDRLQRHHHLLFGEIQLAGDLLHRGIPELFGGEPFLDLHRPIGGIPHRAADSYGVIVPQIAADFPDNHGNGIGGKPDVLADIEVINGLDETDTAHLKEIVQVFPSLGETLDNAEHQPKITVYQLLPGLSVARVHTFEQLHLLIFRQDLQIGCVDPAYFHLVIQARSRPLCTWKYTSSIAI